MKAQAYHIPSQTYPVGGEYHRAVRAAFERRGTTLTAWCAANGYSRQYAYQVLTGKRGGSAAAQLLDTINKYLLETNHV